MIGKRDEDGFGRRHLARHQPQDPQSGIFFKGLQLQLFLSVWLLSTFG